MELEELYRIYKPLLFSLAYPMLGCVTDAEDIVHEVFLDFHPQQHSQIRNTKAFLCKMVTNRCIDYLRSARVKREVYVGPWLPEPLITTEQPDDPTQRFIRKETLSTAFLLLLQRLSPVERAVFICREVFVYDYDEISEIVEKSVANCRQIERRALQKLNDRERQWPQVTPTAKSNALIERFVQAFISGDIEQLMQVLSSDAVLYTDGGGKVHAAIRPIIGRERLLLFFKGIAQKSNELRFQFQEVNGHTGLVFYWNDHIHSVLSFHVHNQEIQHLYHVLNPEKLAHLNK